MTRSGCQEKGRVTASLLFWLVVGEPYARTLCAALGLEGLVAHPPRLPAPLLPGASRSDPRTPPKSSSSASCGFVAALPPQGHRAQPRGRGSPEIMQDSRAGPGRSPP